MKKLLPEDLSALSASCLFKGWDEKILRSLLLKDVCRMEGYEASETVFLTGDKVGDMGLVISGRLRIQREGFDGSLSIIGEVAAGDLFAEAFVCAGIESMPVSVWTVEPSEILFIDYVRMLTLSSDSGSGMSLAGQTFVRNLLQITVNKLLFMNRKIEILSKATTREKLMAYLEQLAEQQEKRGFRENTRAEKEKSFPIPLKRQELADFLGVNRSALSREIGKMQREGIVEFSKNAFKLRRR